MGIGSKFKKAVKKVFKGAKKVFSGVKKVAGEVFNGLRKVGRELKRFAKSDLGKVVIAAALIYAGGAAYLAANSGGATTFSQALMSPGKVFSQFSGAAASSKGAANTAVASTDKAAAAVKAASDSKVAVDAMATGLAETGAQAGSINNLNAAVNAGGSQLAPLSGAGGGAAGGAGVGVDAAGQGFWASMKSNPLTQYGLLQMGGNAIAGYGQPTEEELLEKQYELERQRRQELIDGNVVAGISPSAFAGYSYDPVNGTDGVISQQSPGQGSVSQPAQAIRNQYTTQGLLRQGAL